MIRSALIALDGSPASEVATGIAIRFVKKRESGSRREGAGPLLLTGIAVLDRPTITKPQATSVGGGTFKKQRDDALLADASQKIRQILDDFKSACEAAGVDYTTVRAEGLPYEAIASASHVHDLVVIGRDTNFHFQTSDDRCETFKRLLRDHPCPVVVTPNAFAEGNDVVIAYDGSRAASRALHTFALTEPNLEDVTCHVVSVDRSQDQTENWCSEAVELLKRHSIDACAHPVISTANPTRILIDTCGELNAGLVVMGAFGRKGLRSVFFGSTTHEMLDKCLFPLFVY